MMFTSILCHPDDPGRRAPPPAPPHSDPAQGLPLATPILIVEDEVLIAWTLHDMLADIGFSDIRMARDCAEACNLAAARAPGMLICDVNLGSGDDGVATAARIQSQGRVPVLFITGYAGDEIRARIDQAIAGAPLLRKPIQARPLLHHLREALAKTRPH